MAIRNLRDGFVNALTGAGTGRDSRQANRYAFRPLSFDEIDASYRSSWLMRRVVDKPAKEMVREWRDWQADKEIIEKIETLERTLDLRNKVKTAEQMRGLGGGGMVLWIDGDQPEAAIEPEKVRIDSLRQIHVWHRSRFTLGALVDTWGDPWFGHPSYYEIQLSTGMFNRRMRFHPSRVVAFRGPQTAGIMGPRSIDEEWWGDSVVQVVMDAVMNVDESQNGFAALIKDAKNRRVGIPGLTDITATADGEALMRKRVEAFALGESMYGASFYDAGDGDGKGGEKIDDRQMAWQGIPDVMGAFLSAAAAAADMPATVLLGKSPDGMNSTGDGDLKIWEQTVKARQDLDLRPCLTQLDAVLIPSALGKVDPDIWFQFAPLSTATEKEEADTFKTTVDAIKVLADTGTVPDEALAKGTQNLLVERGWLPGLDTALAEIPESERYPEQEEEIDPSVLQAAKQSLALPQPRKKIAANDARPRTLYVQRKLLNAAELVAWAKSQGFETTTPADDIHVTIAFSRQPIDWMKVPNDWHSDEDGNFTVPGGGARIVEPLGSKGAIVLLFSSSPLSYRHEAIKEAGANYGFAEYQPHVTITYQSPEGLDLSTVKPFVGALRFGPELFSEVVDDWEKGVTEA